MERLQKWFGGGETGGTNESDANMELTNQTKKAVDLNPEFLGKTILPGSTAQDKRSTAAVTSTEPTSQAKSEPELPEVPWAADIPNEADVTETRIGQLMNEAREQVLKVIPLKEDDCLSCKLVGSGTMFGAAMFVLLKSRTAMAGFTGYKRTLFKVQAASLTTGLLLLGTARFFDLSIFAHPDEDGKKTGIGELMLKDLEDLQKTFSNVLPVKNSSENKPDS